MLCERGADGRGEGATDGGRATNCGRRGTQRAGKRQQATAHSSAADSHTSSKRKERQAGASWMQGRTDVDDGMQTNDGGQKLSLRRFGRLTRFATSMHFTNSNDMHTTHREHL